MVIFAAMILDETIVALATPPGSGAISVIRISGPEAVELVAPVFEGRSKIALTDQKSHTLQLGYIKDGKRIIDESLVSVFRGKRSYTGEPTVEISCHGSPFIQQEIVNLLLRQGCRAANPGEFTMRAFLNGKMDLSQAEAVADLIASDNQATHQIAMNQMRGGFADQIKKLRDELLNFAALIELELDFAEEDVEFADREQFQQLVWEIQKTLNKLIDSFAVGNVLKKGIPVAIIGEPNVGKSTLLNAILQEDRAIVSDIAGTTRDTIEDEIAIGGIGFRFIDTAGIRETTDKIEGLGIQKTFDKIQKASIALLIIPSPKTLDEATKKEMIIDINRLKNRFPDKPFLIVVNKVDLLKEAQVEELRQSLDLITGTDLIFISAKKDRGVDELKEKLKNYVDTGALRNNDTIVTNSRHYDSLLKAQEEINRVQEGLNIGLTGDLLAIDIRQALHYFGEITGEITTDDLLGHIFSNFCIGK